ncbi:unnamed protein product [Prunus armeniaca]|uniref:Uncharacterized protein n=1 Tax=Prunus armeniaca TaxID=36596 RepID=A0A6J5WEI2_PRUAR|nr:unnamed protein product [Prunus armeniaca]
MVEFVSCGFLLSIDIVILNMLPDMFSAEIPYMKCMNFEFEIVAFALSKPDMDANRLGSSLPISLGISYVIGHECLVRRIVIYVGSFEMGSGELHMQENITFITQLITWRFEIGQKLLVSSRLEDGLRNEDAPPVLFHHINIVVIGVELDISCALM